MKKHDELIKRLEAHRTPAPEHFADQVMDALPAWRTAKRQSGWQRQVRWLVPALAGAAAMFVVMLGVNHKTGDAPVQQVAENAPASDKVVVYFELHAPGADQVELLGTFNDWTSGDIVLNGPDESGLWTATVELPEGRHEYMFLVDGEQWWADPKASTRRSDGFGHENAIIQVYGDEGNA